MFRKFERNKYVNSLCSLYLLLIASLCICSCTSEYNIFDNNNSKLLKFSVSVPEWKNNDSSSNSKTRATPISGTSLGTSSSFNIIADAYDGKSNYSTIINKEAVSFTNNMWKTVAPHYWPGIANNTVSFYAYYPTSISSSISHTVGSTPTLSYTVPDDATNQIDIMTAIGKNISGNTNASTPLAFNHILAAVQFSIGSAGMPNGTITGIALNNILYKGTYSLNGTWTQDATSKKSFSQTVSSSTNAGTTITSGTTTFMMMPQTLGSDASITVTYSNGGTLTQSITGTWNAGKIYTYSIFKTIPIANFDYTGNIQTYTVPLTGTYKLEVWGAQGGMSLGKGGYSYGVVSLTKNTTIYVCVGGQGGNPTYSSDYSYSKSGTSLGGTGGYNGGGKGGDGSAAYSGDGGGGGATHIAFSNGLLNTLSSNKFSVLLVAGGGGCSGGGGSGGGVNGISSTFGGYTSVGGGQTSGYQFGQGQAGYSKTAYGSCGAEGNGGAGGGWYGGYACQTGNGNNTNVGGGGGSGYIGSGVTGATIAGNNSFTDNDGTTVTGHAGNGYARITFVSAN